MLSGNNYSGLYFLQIVFYQASIWSTPSQLLSKIRKVLMTSLYDVIRGGIYIYDKYSSN